MDKNIFGNYELIDFSNVKTVEDVESILDPIFTNNPHFWGKSKLYYNYSGKDILETVKHFISGDIKIYRYEYDLPSLPNEENNEDMVKFDTFYKWSKAKYETLPLLYWYADNFLNLSGHSLYNLSTVSKNIMVAKNNYDKVKEILSAINMDSYTKFRNNESNYIFPDENIAVYIGEIDVPKIKNEINRKCKYILVFPYFLEDLVKECSDGHKGNCYLFEIDEKLILKHEREMFEITKHVQEILHPKSDC